jgi:anaerobic magnesium-protoporphyrin IX monomethyl ester cyclase
LSRVLLGQSYFLRFDPKLWQTMQPYPPLGTLYAAGELRRRGHQVTLFDAMLADSEDEWGQALEENHPDVALLYEDNFNYLSKMCLLRMREAAMRMIDLARQRGSTVVLCGADASDHVGEYLARGADFVLQGEGEVTLKELLERLEGKSNTAFENILGLAYRAEGAAHSNPRRPDIHDLDSLALPARDLVDVERYRSIWLDRHGYFSMNLVSTRGCPFHCNWCAKPIWGQRYHSRSPQAVAAEMRLLKDSYHPDHLWFADDIFGLKPGWLAQFARDVESQAARIPYKCLSRVDLLLRPGEIDALAQSGAQTIWVGAESGSQKILNAMDKGTQVEQIGQVRQKLRAAGIGVGFFLQFGYPGETREDIEKTLQMVRDCDPDDIGISVSYAMPGTKFYENVSSQLGARRNWQDSSDLAMLFQGTFSTAFYRKLHSVVHKEFRSRKALRALSASFRSGSPVGWRTRLWLTARWIYNRMTLPLARLQLNRLAAVPGQAAGLSLAHLPPEAAAQPSLQDPQFKDGQG